MTSLRRRMTEDMTVHNHYRPYINDVFMKS